tara:strand:+ start:348 stop:578 length:231 start_codon:yes stop_codon:yes gene_type:complete
MAMPKMEEMVEAHLMNVQREIANLEERKVTIDTEIEKLKSYLSEGQATLTEAKSTQVIKQDAPASTVFSPNLGGGS